MQVGKTSVIVDRTQDPFKDFDATIVGNIVDYNSSSDEEEYQKPKEKDATFGKKIESSIDVTTSSVPLASIVETPSTPPTQEILVTTTKIQSN